MALRFKIAKRKLYLGKRKGQTVYYAIQEEHPHTSWDEVEGRITSSTGISRADLRAAVIALHDIVRVELKAGRSIDLADLGSFKATASGKMMDNFAAVSADTIQHASIRFYPKQKLWSITKELNFEVEKEEHHPSSKKKAKKPSKPKGEGGGNPPSGGGESGHVGA